MWGYSGHDAKVRGTGDAARQCVAQRPDLESWGQSFCFTLTMFAQLKGIVDLVRNGVSDFRNFKTEKERKEAVLDVLRVYFVLKDCVDDGEKLISEAQPNPVQKIVGMEPDLALATIERWDAVIRKQGMRLYWLQGAFLGQDHIAIINPELQDRIGKAIGYKMDRTVTLHGIGSALYFKNMFPVANSIEEKAHYISVMAGEEVDSLNMPRISSEIETLRQSLIEYRAVVERMVSNAELLQLSSNARRQTLFADDGPERSIQS